MITWLKLMNSTEAVQAYRQRQKDKGRNQRALYATDAEFRAIKALLRFVRMDNTLSASDPNAGLLTEVSITNNLSLCIATAKNPPTTKMREGE